MHQPANHQIHNLIANTEHQKLLHQTLYTVDQFAIAEPAFTPAALRNLIFKAESRHSSKGEIPGNGLIECGAIIRVGKKVMIHGERFLTWVQNSNKVRG